MSRSTAYSGTYGPVYDVRRHFTTHPSLVAHSRISQRSRPHSPLSCSSISSVYSEDESRTRLRWILSLGLLLPALAAIIGERHPSDRSPFSFCFRLIQSSLLSLFTDERLLFSAGVVAWAVSAEIVIGARRDHALKTSDALRFLPQVCQFIHA